jgi:hypothetical protein
MDAQESILKLIGEIDQITKELMKLTRYTGRLEERIDAVKAREKELTLALNELYKINDAIEERVHRLEKK